jgi:aryl-alcohol dehydrogenase-like predicted oxidoreductase
MGATGLSVSEIGFGCGGNAGLMIRGGFDEQLRIVARSVDLGINYFDNAPDYGDGLAEENLGRVLKALKLRPLLNSKVEVRRENLGHIAEHVVRSTEDSLRRLGVDCLDVLQIHNGPSATAPVMEGSVYRTLGIDDFMRPGGALDGLQRVLRDGKARYVGFICRGDDGDPVRQLLDTGICHMINVPYTLLNPSAGIARPAALEVERDGGGVLNDALVKGVGSAIYSVLAGGFLSDDSVAGSQRHPLARSVDPATQAARRNRDKAQMLRFLARESGMSLAQAAFRFVLSHAGVTTALGGFSSMSQLEELCAVSDANPFAGDLLERLEQLWQTNFAAG